MKLKEFKAIWVGRKFKCLETGVVLELTEDNVHPRAFLAVGNAFIDLGNGGYSRTVGRIEEVK